MPSSLSATILVGLIAFLVLKLAGIGQRESGLPPGPPTVPLVGNILQLPLSRAHFRYANNTRFYRDSEYHINEFIDLRSMRRHMERFIRCVATVSYPPKSFLSLLKLKVGPITVVLVNSAITAYELLDVRGASTSDRPVMRSGDMITGYNYLPLMRSSTP
jgi:hypothetical protein